MNFPYFLDELSEFHSTFLILPNFPDELFEFSGLTFRILLNFPNFSSPNRWGPFFSFFSFFFFRSHLRNFPNLAQLSEFLDEFSEFCSTCLIFSNFPDELSEFCSTFLIFPNFPDELSKFSGWTVRILLNFPNLSSQNRWGPFFFSSFF